MIWQILPTKSDKIDMCEMLTNKVLSNPEKHNTINKIIISTIDEFDTPSLFHPRVKNIKTFGKL